MYFANVQFGLSVGGIMAPEYLGQPWSIGKARSVLEHLWIPVIVIGTSGTAGMIRRLRANLLDELQKPRGDRACEGHAALRPAREVPAAHGAQPVHRRHRQPSAERDLRLRDRRGGAFAANLGPHAARSAAQPGPVPRRFVPDVPVLLTVIGMFISDVLLAALDPRIRLTGGVAK